MPKKIKTNFSIEYKETNSFRMIDFHSHQTFEIYYTLTDDLTFFINDKYYLLQKGDLIILNNKDLHKVIGTNNCIYKRYVIEFKPAFIEDFSTPDTNLLECFLERKEDQNSFIHLDEVQQNDIVELLDRTIKIIENSPYKYEIYKKILLAEILIRINHYYHTNEKVERFRYDANYEKAKPIIEYIKSNLANDINIDDLAAKFYMSRRSISCLFKKVTCYTINDYIIKMRILKSKELLLRNTSVMDACEKSGFNNYSHFIRTFTKLVGVSPKQFSKNYQD